MLYESESKIYPNRTKIDYGQESLNETMNRLQNEKEVFCGFALKKILILEIRLYYLISMKEMKRRLICKVQY